MSEKLAIHGGPKAKTTENYPMYPGGLEIGDEEKKQVLEVLDNKYLFRYYGPAGCESKVKRFETEFAEKMGAILRSLNRRASPLSIRSWR